jgi:GxxExxY protein
MNDLPEDHRQGAKAAKTAKGRFVVEPPDPLDALARAVIGAAIEVHQVLGPGFLERTYEDAMCVELSLRGIRVERQLVLPITYKERVLSEARLDLLVEGELVMEIKAVKCLEDIHLAQLMSYLRAGCFQLGLLMNFNAPRLKDGLRRIVWTG